MAPLSNLISSLLTSLSTPIPTVSSASASPNAPNLYVPDLKGRNAIIFGTLSTLLATIGIIFTGATLRVAYQTRRGQSQGLDQVGTEGTEMDSMDEGRSVSRISTAETSVEPSEQ